MVLIGKMYEMKKVINIVLLVLLIILVTFSLAGLIYSIFYECKGYMINCLPDVGTPADFCGAAGTTLAVVFTWQQIKDSDEEAQNRRRETELQFDTTIEEMQKKREEAYKPDVCFNTNIISIQYDNSQNDFCDDKVTFTIINLGVGTAKDIRVKAYSDSNYNKLCQDISWFKDQTQKIGDVKDSLYYTDCCGKTVSDYFEPISGGYLFSKDSDKNIELPKVYLYALKDYCCKLFDEDKIDGDPYYCLPKFMYDIQYQDQEGIYYSRKVCIKPNISGYQTGGNGECLSFDMNLKIENLAIKKEDC